MSSPFASIEQAPADPILGLTEQYVADTNPNKVNLGVGVYQNDQGKVPVLKVVRDAEELWYSREDSKGYIPIDGVPAYNREVQALLLGAESTVIEEGRAVTAEGLGGTGSLKIGADFLRWFFPDVPIYISSPSWENHQALFEKAGFAVREYAYYDANSHGLDFDGMMQSLGSLPSRSIVVLHACCHNPTGVDLSPHQWDSVVGLFKDSDHIPFIDFAYQGFGKGINEDAYAVRAFATAGIPCLIASSFSKSLSLYRERVGALTIQTSSKDESKRVLSQLKRVIRTNYSSPPSHGGQVAALILGNPELRARWEVELTEMRERILRMRSLFVQGLAAKGLDFGFIENQVGMFSYSGIPLEAVRKLRSDYSLYILDSGRICVAAMNPSNMGYICDSIAAVLGTG